MLVLIMGNTTMATSTILAAFMGGLALGSYYWGRRVEKGRMPGLKLFGRLEVGVGLYAFVFPLLMLAASPLEIWIASLTHPGDTPRLILRFLICISMLTPPTFLMGGTFAAIGHDLIRRQDTFCRRTALLYGLNTTGAVLGALLTGFILIHTLGHRNCLWLAGAISMAVGGLALWRTRRVDDRAGHRPTKKMSVPATLRKPARQIDRRVMAGLLVSGFCAMAYQVLWTRILILIADNSVYAFTAILTMFLVGIAAGSLLLSLVIDRIRRPGPVFGWTLVCIAVTAYGYPFFIELRPIDLETPYWIFLMVKLPLVLLIPTMLMGMALPLAAHIHQLAQGTVGSSIGTVLAVNTIGAVAGAVLAGFWLIPGLGFRNGLLILSTANLVMGAWIITGSCKRLTASVSLALLAALAWAGYMAMPADYFQKKYARIEPGSKLIYYNEDKAANVTVFQRPDGNRVLYINGIPEVDTSYLSVRTLKLLGILAGAVGNPPGDALMVTFGAGITAGAAALYADNVDCVDLAEQARTVAGFFAPVNNRVADNPKVRIHVDDARHYLRARDRKYALIVSDATHPRSYDSWILFTRQFYELVQRRLKDDGAFCQWLPFHGMDPQQFTSIVRTFAHVFEHTSIWREGEAYIVLLATPAPLAIDFAEMNRRLNRPDVRKAMASVSLNNPIELLRSFSMGPEQIAKLTGNAPLIEDNSPAHLFFSFRATLKEQYHQWPLENYRLIEGHEESVLPFITHIDADQKRRRAITNRIRLNEMRKKRSGE
ncbi:MAG: hypothetical protein CR984_07790 [Proteobacteria bacterium]|nr:MAG: hypothetical protein CR984_07790 [Pseudomonadota bacterium]